MFRRRTVILLVSLIVLAGGGFLAARSLKLYYKPNPPPTLIYEPEVVYSISGGQELKLNLARPRDQNGKAPAVMLLHGGGWFGGDKDSLRRMQFFIAEAGAICISVQYRFAPQYKFPAQLEDVKCAVRWLRAHAGQYHIDPDRIAVMGVSAGAHLGALLALTADQPRFEGTGGYPEYSSAIAAFVGLAGPYDLALGYSNASRQLPKESAATYDMLHKLLGGSPDQVPDLYREASPITYARKDCPPLLICQGEADTLVLADQGDLMVKKLQSHEAPVEYLRVPDATHYGFGKDKAKHYQQIEAFLRKHLTSSTSTP